MRGGFLPCTSPPRDPARALFQLVRSIVGLVFLVAVVWCAFRVPLGRRTFAEHVDRIGETPEARELLDSTRGAVTPLVEDATDRMLGEHIEAPTAPRARAPGPAPQRKQAATPGGKQPRKSGPEPPRVPPTRPRAAAIAAVP